LMDMASVIMSQQDDQDTNWYVHAWASNDHWW
jgi:hypothetical protein